MLQRRDVSFAAVLGLLPFVLAACSDASSSPDPRMQTPLVRVGTVAAPVEGERSFTGVVAARVQSDLGFRVPGKVLERSVDRGQTVYTPDITVALTVESISRMGHAAATAGERIPRLCFWLSN